MVQDALLLTGLCAELLGFALMIKSRGLYGRTRSTKGDNWVPDPEPPFDRGPRFTAIARPQRERAGMYIIMAGLGISAASILVGYAPV